MTRQKKKKKNTKNDLCPSALLIQVGWKHKRFKDRNNLFQMSLTKTAWFVVRGCFLHGIWNNLVLHIWHRLIQI